MTTDLQKASLLKRFAAGLMDFFMLLIVAVGFMVLINGLLGYEQAHDDLRQGYDKYETAYGVDFDINQSQFDAMTKEEQDNFNAAYDALVADDEVMGAYNLVLNLTILTITFSLLLGFVVLEWIVPLLLKNGQTLGKKCFGIGLMRVDGVKISNLQLFVRSILGKFTVEVMIPVYLLIMLVFGTIGGVALVVIGLLGLTQLIVLIASRNNSLIHDLFAGTVAVDLGSQRVFESTQDLVDYQKKIAAERAARQPY